MDLLSSVHPASHIVVAQKGSLHMSELQGVLDQIAEAWKPIPECPSHEVSSVGNVRKVHGAFPRTLKRYKSSAGYPCVWIDGRNRKVHQLAILAFVGPAPERHDVNHKDGDKNNANLSNLEYMTRSENCLHAVRTGLAHHKAPCGSLHGGAVLNEEQALRIRLSSEPCKNLAAQYGVNKSTVHRIKRGDAWKHLAALQAKGKA